jgi:uncharacterized protein YjbJ (UPF0337 family)
VVICTIAWQAILSEHDSKRYTKNRAVAHSIYRQIAVGKGSIFGVKKAQVWRTVARMLAWYLHGILIRGAIGWPSWKQRGSVQQRSGGMNNNLNNRPLGTRGAKDQARGEVNRAGGGIQRFFGRLFGNRRMQGEGMARQAKGNVQHGAGKVERTIDDRLNS